MANNATPAPVSGARLGNGELRRMVAGALANNPGGALSPREIAKTLARSSGAVGNALEALTAAGHADRTSASPRRYRANAHTAAAAAAPAPASAATPAATPAAAGSATPAPGGPPPPGAPPPPPPGAPPPPPPRGGGPRGGRPPG
ncbi:MarR family transcriptional regulator, partial [Nocardia carnea]|uniref:MarR family transcriptional regulator n=1 Tax=Nocardia carnea TaxID=37328 RepID=UPI0024553E37